MADSSGVVVRARGEGNCLSVTGNAIEFKAVSADTAGRLAVLEFTAPAGSAGPRSHIHARTDEAFYVLDGTLTIRVGDKTIRADAGAFVLVPRGLAHTVSNEEGSPARYLAMMTPAGLEGWFEDLAALVQPGMPRPDPGMIAALSERYDHILAESSPVPATS